MEHKKTKKKKLPVTGPVSFETGRSDRLVTEPNRFGYQPASSVTNQSPIRFTCRFELVCYRTGEPTGSGFDFSDF